MLKLHMWFDARGGLVLSVVRGKADGHEVWRHWSYGRCHVVGVGSFGGDVCVLTRSRGTIMKSVARPAWCVEKPK